MHTRRTVSLASARRQRGQTLYLVALSMISLLAISALAVDLASLYAAKGEIQRAADAAALAGAKAFVDSGVTTDPTNKNLPAIAQAMAQSYAAAAAAQNLVSGAPPQMSPPVIDLTSFPGNPRITVTVQRTGLPLFFARIWGGQFASVSASAIAEAYNPAYSQTNTGKFLPSSPKCVKPILVPNNNNTAPNPAIYVDPTTGSPTPFGLDQIGKSLLLTSGCVSSAPGCQIKGTSKNPNAPSSTQYLPLQVSGLGSHLYCSNVLGIGCSAPSTDFQKSLQCCDGSDFDFPQCGANATPASWDQSVNPSAGSPSGPVQAGLECLVHNTPGGGQKDSISTTAFLAGQGPVQISPGPFSQAQYGLQPTDLMATSDSIITVPLFDNSNPNLPETVTIVGFLQLFVNDIGSGAQSGNVASTILNITGCGPALGSAIIAGGGVSAIAVRLVSQ